MRPLRATRKPVSQEIAKREIEKVCDYILKRISPELIYVFGSATTSDFSDQSDIDLLIVCQSPSALRECQAKLGPIEAGTMFPVELVWTTMDEFNRKKNLGGVCMIAHQSGRLLHAKAGE